MSQKNIVKWCVFLIVLIFFTTICGYIYARQSKPFHMTKNAIERSLEINKRLGKIDDVKLSFFGYSIKYSGIDGIASFECDVRGEIASGKVFVRLRRKTGVWIVIDATLDGRTVSL